MKNNTLSNTQLKIIAACAMMVDHVTWGFFDRASIFAVIMHMLGAIAIPVMCFCAAEGFRRSSDVARYIKRLLTFVIISIIPYYVYYNSFSKYRQNGIFDILLGVVWLAILEKTKLKKWQKIAISVAIIAVSIVFSSWPILPLVYIHIFYYGKTFKKQIGFFGIATIAFLASAILLICLNNRYQLIPISLEWWGPLFILGFFLALPLIRVYSGEKGNYVFGKYSFYVFYPLHFLILFVIKVLATTQVTVYDVYLTIHLVTFVGCIILSAISFTYRPSHGQSAIGFFAASAAVYCFGFVLEIISSTPEGYFLACNVQYLGEYITLLSALFFTAAMCRKSIHPANTAGYVVMAIWLQYGLLNTRETGFFYEYIGVNTDGPFARPDLGHSTGFFLSVLYFTMICTQIVVMCVRTNMKGTVLDRRRVKLIFGAIICCWAPYVATLLGLTGGYEVPALGLIAAGACLYLCFVKYGALDSIALASENALDRGHEGVLILDNRYRIVYHNSMVDKILGDFPHTKDVREWDVVKDILSGEISELFIDNKYYDFEIEPILESGIEQGKMIWVLDATEHHASMQKISDEANRDGLTGLYNRSHFKDLVDVEVEKGYSGTFIMMDMDNFKQVNDTYGHQRGDAALISLGNILAGYTDDILYACRIGGDEFCAYVRNVTERHAIEALLEDIMKNFDKTFRESDSVRCTISVGAIINDSAKAPLKNCSTLYQNADKLLYESKNGGKNTYRIG